MGRVSDPTAAIEVHQLVRKFRKGPRAVDGIDLAVTTGEIYGFLGPNGAGKSTTVLMLTTLLPPTSAAGRVGGFDGCLRATAPPPRSGGPRGGALDVVHEGPAVRRAFGAALQEAALDPLLTGREHL